MTQDGARLIPEGRADSSRQAAAVALCGSFVLAASCINGGQPPGAILPAESSATTEPLGWSGPVEAREMRTWTAQSLEEAPQWTLAEAPVRVLTPDTLQAPDGRSEQRSVRSGVIFPGGQLLLAVSVPSGPTRIVAVESPLVPVIDRAGGGQDAPSPTGARVQPRMWAEGGRMALVGDEAVVVGEPLDMGPPVTGLGFKEVLYVGPEGQSMRPPARVDRAGRLRLVGAFGDGGLLFWHCCEDAAADTTVVVAFRSARPMAAANGGSEPSPLDPVFTVALPRDPDQRNAVPRSWAFMSATRFAVWGDTIWALPTERPELVALDRSGEVLLKVDWAVEDRSIPPGARESWGGLQRFPAASSLFVGTDGLLYIQLWTLRDGRPARGPQWLVFDPAGEFVARFEIPGNLTVLAFGPASVLVTARNGVGLQEVRLYALNGS